MRNREILEEKRNSKREVKLMEFSRFLERVNEQKKINPLWFALDSDPSATESEILAVERELGIILPKEYKKFVTVFGGGYFAFTIIFSVNIGSEWNVLIQNKVINLFDTFSFLAVSDNQAGDYYGFKVVDRVCEPKVYIYDHDNQKIKETKYQDLFEYIIGIGLKDYI